MSRLKTSSALYTISAVAPDCNTTARHIMRPFIAPFARPSEQLDTRCSTQTYHRLNQPHQAFTPVAGKLLSRPTEGGIMRWLAGYLLKVAFLLWNCLEQFVSKDFKVKLKVSLLEIAVRNLNTSPKKQSSDFSQSRLRVMTACCFNCLLFALALKRRRSKFTRVVDNLGLREIVQMLTENRGNL